MTPHPLAPLVVFGLLAGLGCSSGPGSRPPGGESPDEGEAPASRAGAPGDTLSLEVRPLDEAAAIPSPIEEPLRRVIRDREEWRRFREERSGGADRPEPPPPEVDFSRWMIVVAAAGRKPTGGHGIEVEGATARGDTVTVRVVTTRPGPGCMTAQVLTHPATAALVESHPGKVVFAESDRVRECR